MKSLFQVNSKNLSNLYFTSDLRCSSLATTNAHNVGFGVFSLLLCLLEGRSSFVRPLYKAYSMEF